MNYQQMLKKFGVLLGDKERGGITDCTITTLRIHGIWGHERLRGVKRRVAKRWAYRLLVEGLPRDARLRAGKKTRVRRCLSKVYRIMS
jgi:hypothetical protein